MKNISMALLFAAAAPAHAAWIAVHYEPSGGVIYVENASMSFSGPVTAGTYPFIRATIHTQYQNAVNSSRVCYPSADDCQWKRLNVTVTYDWACNNTVRMHAVQEEWDEGPTATSWSRDGYTAPEPRPHVAAPTPVAPGATYSIANEPGLMAAQAAICTNWPK